MFAQSNVMAVYAQEKNKDITAESFYIYGSSRVGELDTSINMRTATVSTFSFNRIRGIKRYEMSNHLGNVMVVVSDRKVYDGTVFKADLVSTTDYYAFGMVMSDRSYNTEGYRFGFNGKENDNEVKGTGNQQDYGMRIYDPRLGRFLSVDPLTKDYPELTPYQFASNTPINSVDLDGLEKDVIIHSFGWAAGKVWNLAVGMVKGVVILAVAQTNPVVAAHVGNNIYQSVKSTAKDVKTIAGTGAQIAYGQATGQPAKVDEAKFNDAAQRQAKSIVRTGASAVLATGVAEVIGGVANTTMATSTATTSTTTAATATSDLTSGVAVTETSTTSIVPYNAEFAVRQGLEGGKYNFDKVRSMIPEGTPNGFKPTETILGGEKYTFDINGTKVQLKWHTPDAAAASKYIEGSSGSVNTAQLKVGNKLLNTDGSFTRKATNKTHIPKTE